MPKVSATCLLEGRIQTIRNPRVRTALLSTVVIALVATVGVALQKEIVAKITSPPTVPASVEAPEQPALSPVEEAYALALWPIHSETKLAAVTMSSAGIAYKVEDHDTAKFVAKLEQVRHSFETASAQAQALPVPDSMRKTQEQFLAALALYTNASSEMGKIAIDGSDEHLIAGQGMSQRATESALGVGQILWPGEYKPN
jgi:hypothetical protein